MESTHARRSIDAGWIGLLMLHLACGSRSALEVGASPGTRSPTVTSGGAPGSGSGTGAGGGGGRRADAGTGGAGRGGDVGSGGSALGLATGGSLTLGSGGNGLITPHLSAPDARRTPPTACTAEDWCGALGDYTAIWGSSLVDIWVVARNVAVDETWDGDSKTLGSALLHWNGLAWSMTPVPAAYQMNSIWGASADDVWLAGFSGLLGHFDGASWDWTTFRGSTVWAYSLWGTGPSDVWGVGPGLFHFDGLTWTRVGDSFFSGSSVWTTGADLWLASMGTLSHSQDFAQTWSPPVPNPSSPTPSPWWTVLWGSPGGAPFAAGRGGALGRWTDSSWSVQYVGEPDAAPDFRSLWGQSSGDVWAVGDSGVVAHWDGLTWSTPQRPTTATLRGVWGIDGHYYAVGDGGTFLELTDGGWLANHPDNPKLRGIWGAAPSDVWAVGGDILHWSGASWDPVPSTTDQPLVGVWGSAPDDVWAVGKSGTLLHSSGATWNAWPSPTIEDITGIWGSSASNVWAVCSAGTILHFDGIDWSIWPAENFGPMVAVYGTSQSDVVAVGKAVRLHFDGRAWTRLPDHPINYPTDYPTYLTAFGDGRNVFVGGMVTWTGNMAGGAFPELGRWNGGLMVDNLEPVTDGYSAVTSGWASSTADVWLALPTLTHWDGTAWTPSAALPDLAITALGGTSEDLWAASEAGQMLRRKLN